MHQGKTLGLTDYCVLGGTIACSLFVGLYYAYRERNQHTAFRYHRGAGKLHPLPVALSLLVTFESSIFFLGVPAEIYVHGMKYWLTVVGYLGFSGMLWISIPLFYPLQITSVYEYLERRYGSTFLRQMACVLSTISMLLYSALVLFGAAIALEAVSSIPKESSIVGMTFLAVAYTSLGGLKAVVATDAVQGVFMIVAIFAVLIYGTVSVGGIHTVIALNKDSGRLKLVDFDPNPLTRHTFWTVIIGPFFRTVDCSFRQPLVQRLNSTKSKSDARMVAAIAIAGFIILELFVMAEGLVAYAYFSNKGCDPLASGQISNSNQIMSYTVLDMFASVPGVPGLFLAALCCAALSTVSSQLSSISAIISEDIIKAHCKTITDKKLTMFSKLIVPLTGLLCIALAVLIGGVDGPMTQLAASMLGAVNSPLSCIFYMSVFVKFSTKKGVLSGAAVGMIFAFWISSGYNFSPGRKRTPWLPLGPTDKCSVPGNASSLELADVFINTSNASHTMTPSPTTSDYITNVTEAVAMPTSLHGLDYLYSISYQYFSGIVLIVSLVTAIAVSKCTQPANPKPVPPELMLSCSSRVCCVSSSRCYSEDEVEMDVVAEPDHKELTTPLSDHRDISPSQHKHYER